MTIRRILLQATALLALLGLFPSVHAQDKPLVKAFGASPPRSVAYIGNSFFYFNNGIISHLAPMVAEGMKGHPYRHRISAPMRSANTASLRTTAWCSIRTAVPCLRRRC